MPKASCAPTRARRRSIRRPQVGPLQGAGPPVSPPRVPAAPPPPPRRPYLAPRPLRARQPGELSADRALPGAGAGSAELGVAGPGPGRARAGVAGPAETPPGRGLEPGRAGDGAAAAPGAPRPSAEGFAALWGRLAGEDRDKDGLAEGVRRSCRVSPTSSEPGRLCPSQGWCARLRHGGCVSFWDDTRPRWPQGAHLPALGSRAAAHEAVPIVALCSGLQWHCVCVWGGLALRPFHLSPAPFRVVSMSQCNFPWSSGLLGSQPSMCQGICCSHEAVTVGVTCCCVCTLGDSTMCQC